MSLLGETGTGSNTACVDVADGRIIRVRPLHYDWKQDTSNLTPQILEARGKTLGGEEKTLLPPHSLAYKQRAYSPNRIPCPLRRVDWDPQGERNTGNRGTSKYVPISWDEALDIIAAELRRVTAKYGPETVLAQADGHGETSIVHPSHGCNTLLLKHLGGYTLQTRNPDSWEGWYWGSKHVWGMDPLGQEQPSNLALDVAQNGDLVLYWGCDPETTTWGWEGQRPSKYCYWLTELGIKSIYICPDLNYGAAIHADKWIPIFPNTDAALHLAIAYTWITEGTYDKDYVSTHCFGFEAFEAYVLGGEDGIPKTPKWAAEICGVPSRTIKALAREWASKRTSIAHGNGGPMIRGPYSTEPARLETLNLAMQGLGKPGVHYLLPGFMMWDPGNSVTMPNPQSAYRGWYALRQSAELRGGTVADIVGSWQRGGCSAGSGRSVPLICELDETNPNDGPVPKQFIPKDLVHDAILNPPIKWHGTTLWSEPVEDQFIEYVYPANGCSEIHMIWTDTPCWITCWNDSNSYIKALRDPKIEFILVQHPWMENDCIFGDLILPVSTKFEQTDISTDKEQYGVILLEEQCIEPVGEAKTDYEVVCMIAERMGLLDKVTEGKTVEDWIRYGFENSRVTEFISYEELRERQYFIVPTKPGWRASTNNRLLDFYNDPNKYPLKTPSGKIEFYAQTLATHFPDDDERPPVPHWIPYGESHQESLSHERADEYPLLLVSNHGRWRVHANLDDISWFHEIETGKVKGKDGYWYEPVWIHPSDAAHRSIEEGEVVKLYNERGAVLVGAYVTERIMPGVVYVDHGSRYDPIVPGEFDRGGAINTITPHKLTSRNATGMVVSGFLVECERVNLDALRKQHPKAFARPYDSGSGLTIERVLHVPIECAGTTGHLSPNRGLIPGSSGWR
ncbi:MAG: molybdopterin-dependent oxidoreductase [Actinobacteria bacterium]|nr:molybdopterin-dependent oxidoreductase [Actinomycetota bacterium]